MTMHESGRIVAFEIVDGNKFELIKMSASPYWRIERNGVLIVLSMRKDDVFEIFNNLTAR